MSLEEFTSQCRSCQAPMVWLKTRSGKKCPVDLSSMEQAINKDKIIFDPQTMISHFATCPDAEKYRKTKDAERKEFKGSGTEVSLDL